MPLKPAPIQAPVLGAGAPFSLVWIGWLNELVKAFNALPGAYVAPDAVTLTAGAAPTAAAGTALVWLAAAAGTKDGQAYDVGDVLITSRVGAVSKTLLVLDWSAI